MYYTQITLLSSCTEPDDIETQHLRAFNCWRALLKSF